MANTLLTAGLVCIIAAIIGGGLKAFGIEISAFQSTTRQILLGSLGLILLLGANASSPYTQFDRPPIPNTTGELGMSLQLRPSKVLSIGEDEFIAEHAVRDAKAAVDRVEAIADIAKNNLFAADIVAASQAAGAARAAANSAEAAHHAIADKIRKGDDTAQAQAALSHAEQDAADAKASADRAAALTDQIKVRQQAESE